MSSLHKLQHYFAEQVYGAAGDWPDRHFRSDGIPAADRFDVYRNNVRSSLCDALGDVYPVIRKLLGDEFFRQTARAYLCTFPPATGNLHDFGGELAEQLACEPALAAHPYLPDVARLEWAYHRVYHAADDRSDIDLSRLASLAESQWHDSRFAPRQATALVASDFPVLHIWQANQDGAPPDDVVNLDEGGDRLLVLRNGLECSFLRLDRGAFELLAAFAAGRTLADACERARQAEPGFDLAAALSFFIRQGALASIRIPPANPNHFPETGHVRQH